MNLEAIYQTLKSEYATFDVELTYYPPVDGGVEDLVVEFIRHDEVVVEVGVLYSGECASVVVNIANGENGHYLYTQTGVIEAILAACEASEVRHAL